MLAWALSVGLLLYQARGAFFLGQSSIGHDNLFWFYPVYGFFAESLLQGRLPLWDPFTHGGEAFYPILLQLRLLEPVSYLVLAAGSLFTHDVVTLFNWDRLARGLLAAIGCYVLLRQWTAHWAIRPLLAPLLVWSSLLLTGFQQTGAFDQFIGVPWVAYFLLRIVHDGDSRWRNWIGSGVFVGMAWQSYYFAGVWILLLFLSGGLLLFERAAVKEAVIAPGTLRKVTAAALLVVAMALPNAVVFTERDSYVFPARMLDHPYAGRLPQGGPLQYEPGPSASAIDSIAMPYGLIQYTGTFSSLWDFIQLLTPDANRHARGEGSPHVFGKPSEGFMYVGLLGYLGTLIGIVAGRHPLKRVWLLVTAAVALLMLGPSGGLHPILYAYPPMWVVRHTHVFTGFFVLGMLFFFVLGCNRLVERERAPLFEPSVAAVRLSQNRLASVATWLVTVFAVGLLVAAGTSAFLRVVSDPRPLPVLNWEAAILVLVALAVGLFRRRLGGLGMVAAVLAAHLIVAVRHAPEPSAVLSYLAIFVLLPVMVLCVARRGSPRAWAMALAVASLFLVTDLASYLARSSWLWHWERPDRALGISALPREPVGPEPRVVTLPSNDLYTHYSQPIRYQALATRRSVAFSSLMYNPDEPEGLFLSQPLPLSVGTSLAGWRVRDGLWRLDGAITSPPGAVWPEVATERVREGSLGARLFRVIGVPTEVRLSVPVPSQVRGKRLWARVWVRSENRAPDGVQAELGAGGAPSVKSYGNSWGWEPLTLLTQAEGNAAVFVARVTPAATASAVFEGLDLRWGPDEDGSDTGFDLALVRAARRWNTFLMPTAYFELIHADLPAPTLAEILAIGKPLAQFRIDGRQVSRSQLPAALRTLGTEAGRERLARTVYLDAGGASQEAPSAAEGSTSARVEIAAYDYNSLEFLVEAPAPGYLYVADGFDRQWLGLLDGRRARVLRANLAFKAVRIPAGRHRVRLDYRPTVFLVAAGIYFAGAAAGLGIVGFASFRENWRVGRR